MLLPYITWALPVAAQDPPPPSPVQLIVAAGYNGRYHPDHWFPITVEVTNTGVDLDATLEWDFDDWSNTGTFQRDIDLPRGARKRVTFYALAQNHRQQGTLRVLANGELIETQDVPINPINNNSYVVGVVSSNQDLLNSLIGRMVGGWNIEKIALEPHELSVHIPVLSAMDAIFLHDVDTLQELTAEQRQALQLWVSLGGTLVVGGGIHAEQTTAGLDPLLPIRVGQLGQSGDLSGLLELLEEEQFQPPVSQSPINLVELRPTGEAIDLDGLLTRRPLGAGHVIFTAFDLADLRGWTGEASLWTALLDMNVNAQPFMGNINATFDNALQLNQLFLPSFWVLLAYIVFYILVIGLVNFLVLRRLRRLELAWITTPALILLFVVATYGVGLLIRGVQPIVVQATLVHGFEGQDQAMAQAMVGLYSPRRDTYQLTRANEVMMQRLNIWNENNQSATAMAWTDTTSQMRDILVDVSSLREFQLQETVALDIMVSSEITTIDQRTFRITVTNRGNQPIQDASVVYRNAIVPIGTLQPAEARETTITADLPDENNTVTGLQESTDDVLHRNRLLATWLSSDSIGPWGGDTATINRIPDDQVYLMAWQDQPLLDLELNGQPFAQQGLSFYLIQLGETASPYEAR